MSDSAIEHLDRPTLVVRASAGTGKTFLLTGRYLRLLLMGECPSRILAATFTRKAAGEILSRIVGRLVEALATAEGPGELGTKIALADLDGPTCLQALARLSASIHTIQVSTLDSYFSSRARAYAPWLGLPPGWSIADPTIERQLQGQAIEEMLAESDTASVVALTHLLSKGEAVRRVGELLQHAVDDVYALYLEAEQEGVAAWVRDRLQPPHGGEVLASCREQIESFQDDFPKLHDAILADLDRWDHQQWPKFLTTGLAAKIAKGETTYRRNEIPGKMVRLYGPLVDHARFLVVSQAIQQTEGAWRLASNLHDRLQRLKRRALSLSFDDLPRAMVRYEDRARTLSAVGGVTPQIQDTQVRHLLLDEFQDTSTIQWRALLPLVRRLTGPSPSGTFFCVGDTKQSIYGWRGGVPELLSDIATRLPNAVECTIAQSFRSSPVIIETVNRVCSSLAKHPDLKNYAPTVKRWSDQFPTHSTDKHDLSGHVVIHEVRDRKGGSEEDFDGEGAEEEQEDSSDLVRTAAVAVQRLQERHPGASIVVLASRNETVADLICELQRLKVDASEEGGRTLTDSAAVETVLSCIQFAHHPDDTAALFHLRHGPLAQVLGVGERPSPTDSPREITAARLRREFTERGIAACLRDWKPHFETWCSPREWLRYNQLIQLADEFDARPWSSLVAFAEWIRAQPVEAPLAADVRVMTIHKSKGLEFDIVVLLGLDESLFRTPKFVYDRDPDDYRITKVFRYVGQSLQAELPNELAQLFTATTQRLVEERLCQLYVALTRAKRALHVFVRSVDGTRKSLAGLLASSLELSPPEKNSNETHRVVYEVGDAAWRMGDRTPDSVQSKPATIAPVDLPMIRFHHDDKASLKRRHWPSHPRLGAGGAVPIEPLLANPYGSDRVLGILAHAVLAQIEWLEPDATESFVKRVLTELVPADCHSKPFFSRLRQWLEIPDVRSVTRRSEISSRAPAELRVADQRGEVTWKVRTECYLAARVEDDWIAGRLDRLLWAERNGVPEWAFVVDFKSDGLWQDSTSGAKETHRPNESQRHREQLIAYRELVTRSLRLRRDCVWAAICHLDDGRLTLLDADGTEQASPTI